MIAKLPTDFVDEVTSQYKYKIADLDKGLSEVENVTEFSVKGSYYGATEVKNQRKAVNSLVDVTKNNESVLNNIVNGNPQINVEHSENARTAIQSETSQHSVKGHKFRVPVQINGVEFDGNKNITITDDTKVSKNESFILTCKKALSFSNGKCTISDSKITSNSLADLIIEKSSMSEAHRCRLDIETNNGNVVITAYRTPKKTIYGSVIIRS